MTRPVRPLESWQLPIEVAAAVLSILLARRNARSGTADPKLSRLLVQRAVATGVLNLFFTWRRWRLSRRPAG